MTVTIIRIKGEQEFIVYTGYNNPKTDKYDILLRLHPEHMTIRRGSHNYYIQKQEFSYIKNDDIYNSDYRLPHKMINDDLVNEITNLQTNDEISVRLSGAIIGITNMLNELLDMAENMRNNPQIVSHNMDKSYLINKRAGDYALLYSKVVTYISTIDGYLLVHSIIDILYDQHLEINCSILDIAASCDIIAANHIDNLCKKYTICVSVKSAKTFLLIYYIHNICLYNRLQVVHCDNVMI